MCNRFVPPPTLGTIDDEIRQLRIVLEFPAGRPNLPPEYGIGDSPLVVRRAGDGLSLTSMTWAWKGPCGKPVFNFRSDGRTLGPVRRWSGWTRRGRRVSCCGPGWVSVGDPGLPWHLRVL